jgi:hypothetical protein
MSLSQAGRVTQVADHLPSKCEALSSSPSISQGLQAINFQSSYFFILVLGIELKTLSLLGKHSTT